MITFPQRLLSGYEAFIGNRFGTEQARYRALAESGQAPKIMLIGCSDSRAAPETIFDAGPGEVFVVRNVANLVPPYEPDDEYHGTSAALEFAVKALKVEHIVIMGHGRCGGVRAALDASPAALSPGDFIGKWVSLLGPAAATLAGTSLMTDAERQTALERIAIRYSVANLRTFPFVAEREREGALFLSGAWFDISSGELWVLDPETGDFERPQPQIRTE